MLQKKKVAKEERIPEEEGKKIRNCKKRPHVHSESIECRSRVISIPRASQLFIEGIYSERSQPSPVAIKVARRGICFCQRLSSTLHSSNDGEQQPVPDLCCIGMSCWQFWNLPPICDLSKQ